MLKRSRVMLSLVIIIFVFTLCVVPNALAGHVADASGQGRYTPGQMPMNVDYSGSDLGAVAANCRPGELSAADRTLHPIIQQAIIREQNNFYDSALAGDAAGCGSSHYNAQYLRLNGDQILSGYAAAMAAGMAQQQPSTFTITYSSGEGGTISPNNDMHTSAVNDGYSSIPSAYAAGIASAQEQWFAANANGSSQHADAMNMASQLAAVAGGAVVYDPASGSYTATNAQGNTIYASYTPTGAVQQMASQSAAWHTYTSDAGAQNLLREANRLTSQYMAAQTGVAADDYLNAAREMAAAARANAGDIANTPQSTSETSVTVTGGANQTFYITASPNYAIDTVTVDDSSVTVNDSQYTFSNITANHTIKVTFKKVSKFSMNFDADAPITDRNGANLTARHASIKSGYGVFLHIPVNEMVNLQGAPKATMKATFFKNKNAEHELVFVSSGSGGYFELPVNPESPTDAKCAYIPVGTKDKKYDIAITVTAKGVDDKNYSFTHTYTIEVKGSMYDDVQFS